MRPLAVFSLLACAILAASAPAVAITNGTPDGGAHPYVGFIIGTDSDADNCSGSHQFITTCSAVLIAPDVVLTTRRCAFTSQNILNQGLVDEIWLILAENPFSTTVPSAFDCTRFRDLDENGINFDPNIMPNLGVLKLSIPVTDIVPAALPIENRLQNVPRGQNDLTFAAMSTVPGQTIRSMRRRSATGRTDPPLTPDFHPVSVTTPEGTCFGFFTEGGGTFVRDTNEMVSMISIFSSTGACGTTELLQRLDTADARAFLVQFVTLP